MGWMPLLEANESQRIRSPWREFEYWFSVLQGAVMPKVSLEQEFKRWPDTRARLSECPRKRVPQRFHIDPLF